MRQLFAHRVLVVTVAVAMLILVPATLERTSHHVVPAVLLIAGLWLAAAATFGSFMIRSHAPGHRYLAASHGEV